jgi:hypothetical protein
VSLTFNCNVLGSLSRWIGEIWDKDKETWIDPPDNGVPRSFEALAELQEGTIVKVYAYQEKTHGTFLRKNWAGIKFWKKSSFKNWKQSTVVVK